MKFLILSVLFCAWNAQAQMGLPTGTGAGSGAMSATPDSSYSTGATGVSGSTPNPYINPQSMNTSPNPAPNLNQSGTLEDASTLGPNPSGNVQDRQSQEANPMGNPSNINNLMDVNGRPLGPGVK